MLIGHQFRTMGALAPEIITPGEAPLTHQIIDVATAAAHEIVFAVPGAKIGLRELVIWNAGAVQDLELLTGAGRRIFRFSQMSAGTGYTVRDNGKPFYILETSQGLILSLSAAGQVDGYVRYGVLEQQAY